MQDHHKIFNQWLVKATDKHLFYSWAYGGNVLQTRLDEEGCGAVIGAAMADLEK